MSATVDRLEQRMAHLARANEVRTERACFKRQLRSQAASETTLQVAALIQAADPQVANMRLEELLLCVPRVGVQAARRIRRRAGGYDPISPDIRVGAIGYSRRQAVASELRALALLAQRREERAA